MAMATPRYYICNMCNEDIEIGQECQLPGIQYLYHDKCMPKEFKELIILREERIKILTIIPNDYLVEDNAFESVQSLVSDWQKENEAILAERDKLRQILKERAK